MQAEKSHIETDSVSAAMSSSSLPVRPRIKEASPPERSRTISNHSGQHAAVQASRYNPDRGFSRKYSAMWPLPSVEKEASDSSETETVCDDDESEYSEIDSSHAENQSRKDDNQSTGTMASSRLRGHMDQSEQGHEPQFGLVTESCSARLSMIQQAARSRAIGEFPNERVAHRHQE